MPVRYALALLLFVTPLAEARDRAILIYPREHAWSRHVFYTSHQRILRQRIGEQYDVEVHEQVGTAEALFSIDVHGAKLLVLSAHGDAFSMRFASRNERTIDSRDRIRLEEFLSRLDPSATIVLQSCATGQGFARLVKDAAGPARHVIAARGEVPRNGLTITSLAPFDVTIKCDDGGQAWDCTLRLR